MNLNRVGVDVARLRRRAELSQAELARQSGTTQAVISRLENGLRLPGYQVLDQIADALGGNITVSFGTPPVLPSREERRRRVRAVIGDYEFDPWARKPAPAEARSLEADGLGRERFARG